jgi:hypothetical protein
MRMLGAASGNQPVQKAMNITCAFLKPGGAARGTHQNCLTRRPALAGVLHAAVQACWAAPTPTMHQLQACPDSLLDQPCSTL